MTQKLLILVFIITGGLLAGCSSINMYDNARLKPLEPLPFFASGSSSQDEVENTVNNNAEAQPGAFTTGKTPSGDLVQTMPVSITLELLQQGQTQFNVYCSPCHGLDGYGQGYIVQRGFSPPPSFHIDRLRQAPDGHFFDVITNGFGRMYSYGYRVEAADRWAIIAYIRALQLSQNATMNDVPPDKRP